MDAMKPVLQQLSEMTKSNPLPAVKSPSAAAAQLGTFSKWFVEHGGFLREGVNAEILPGYGNSLVLSGEGAKDIAEGELVVSVPRTLILSEETALHIDTIPELFGDAAVASQFPETIVALQVMYELERGGPSSFWAPFLSVLPERYETPLFWSWDDFGALRGSPALYESLMSVKTAATQFCHFFHEIDTNREASRFMSLRLFSWPLFAWALSAVMTRKNRVPVLPDADKEVLKARKKAAGPAKGEEAEPQEEEEQQTMVCLIPMWDFHNHEPGKITTFAVPPSGTVECRAMRAFKAGEQIFIHYGDRPNMQLLSHNGFVLTNAQNPADIILINKPTLTDPDEKLLQQKRSLLAQYVPQEVGPYAYFISTHSGEPSPALMATLRVQAMKQDEMMNLPDVIPDLTASKLNDDNEKAASKKLAEACLRQLLGYPTRFADDCAELVAARAGNTKITCKSSVQLYARALCLLEKYGLMRASGLLRTFPGTDSLDFDFGVFSTLEVAPQPQQQQQQPAHPTPSSSSRRSRNKSRR